MDEYATDSPGPGAYSLKGKNEAPSFTMSSRVRKNNRSGQTPGPGQYVFDTQATSKVTPAFSMTGKVTDGGKAGSSPGPGAYGVTGTSIGESAPAFSMAGRHVQESHEVMPGPGHYDSNKSTMEGTHPVTMKGRNFPNNRSDTASPGPGAYNLSQSKGVGSGPKYSMSRRHRQRGEAATNPGPGAYLVPTTIGRGGPSFSLSGRTSRKVGIMRD